MEEMNAIEIAVKEAKENEVRKILLMLSEMERTEEIEKAIQEIKKMLNN